MSILGYSEIIREVYGITPGSIKHDLEKLMKAKPTEDKIQLIKQLARANRATVSELLRDIGKNNTGGSFIAAQKFLDELCTLKLLKREKAGRRTYYGFNKDTDLQRWLLAA
jgi:hypothetical protein